MGNLRYSNHSRNFLFNLHDRVDHTSRPKVNILSLFTPVFLSFTRLQLISRTDS
jgi:hypothetical protein